MKKTALAAAFVLFAALAQARDPEWGGLGAVAVSPDGKTICVGGDNRVLYVVAAGSHEVQQRIWVRARVGALAFNKDGSRLLLEDDDEVLHFFDTSNWKELSTVPDAADCSFAPGADLLAAVGSRPKPCIRFLSMTDGSEKGKAELAARPLCVGLDATGTKAAALTEINAKESEEKKLESAAMPKDLKGAARKDWTQRNDGKTSTLSWFEAPTGKAGATSKVFYSAYGRLHMFLAGGAAHVVTYDDACVRLTEAGEGTIFEVTGSYNYGRASSPDGKTVVGGGLRSGAIGAPGGATAKFEVDSLPGWPEYYAGFAFAPDGTCYGVTSASRLVRITKDGKVEAAVPIF